MPVQQAPGDPGRVNADLKLFGHAWIRFRHPMGSSCVTPLAVLRRHDTEGRLRDLAGHLDAVDAFVGIM